VRHQKVSMFPDGNVTCGMIPRARNHWGFSGPEQGEYALNRLVYERFGSRKGLVHFFYHGILAWLGLYSRYWKVYPAPHQRIVFICSGNICRSPLAEVYARMLGREAASCGLHCGDGHPADIRAIEFAKRCGLELKDHRTVNARDFEFRSSDLIVVMEPAHANTFRSMVGEDYNLVLAGSYCKNPYPYIHDPYNCCDEFFVRCEERVVEAVRGICG